METNPANSDLITVEGTRDEWLEFLPRLIAAYNESQSIEYAFEQLPRFLREEKDRERNRQQVVSNKLPDLDWYDKKLK
jgi:hypothetical protein